MKSQPVTHRHGKVIIIGGGESLSGFDFSRLNDFNGAVIAVNNTVLHLPRADYWITIDMSWDWKQLIRPGMRKPSCYYYAGVPNNLYNDSIFMFVHQLRRVKNFTSDKSEICGGNSSLAALNLALHFEPSKILLTGVDCIGSGHWYDKNEKFYPDTEKAKLAVQNIPRLFERTSGLLSTKNIKVLNASEISMISCFEKCGIERGIKWIS